MPERIQLRRTRGWRKPSGAIVVARPGPFGNPFHVGAITPDGATVVDRADAVDRFRRWINTDVDDFADRRAGILARLEELRGHDLACWCPPDGPCHADVLIDLANS